MCAIRLTCSENNKLIIILTDNLNGISGFGDEDGYESNRKLDSYRRVWTQLSCNWLQ